VAPRALWGAKRNGYGTLIEPTSSVQSSSAEVRSFTAEMEGSAFNALAMLELQGDRIQTSNLWIMSGRELT